MTPVGSRNLCVLTERYDRRITSNKLCRSTLAVSCLKKRNGRWMVLPNDMLMPIHAVHTASKKNKTIWHQTLDTAFTLNTFPEEETLIYERKAVWWCISYVLFHRQREECHHGLFLYITIPGNKLIANKTSLRGTMSNIRQELSPSVKANMLGER